MVEENANSRFLINKGEVEFLDKDFKLIKEKDYFQKRRLENITFFEKLSVGDIVKLKRTGRIVVVTEIDYQINDFIKSDYVGYFYNYSEEDLILFGQDDIEKKYSINIEEAKEMKKTL